MFSNQDDTPPHAMGMAFRAECFWALGKIRENFHMTMTARETAWTPAPARSTHSGEGVAHPADRGRVGKAAAVARFALGMAISVAIGIAAALALTGVVAF